MINERFEIVPAGRFGDTRRSPRTTEAGVFLSAPLCRRGVLAALIALGALPAFAQAVIYTYDSAGHLIMANYGSAGSIAYTYDSAGHLVSRALSTVPLTGVSILTVPAGLQFSVDGGVAQIAPQTLNLSQGTHTIAVVTLQAGSAGSQYVFTSWSDNGAASHNITAGSTAATYTATFQTQYQLTIAASPLADGTVTPASAGFYNSSSVVPITAAANSGYSFTSWTGAVASPSSASTSVTMAAPEAVTANFTAITSVPAFFTGEDALGSGVYYLAFPDTNLFGYYAFTGGGWIDHFDMGYEYVDSGTGTSVYFWDLASGHWWYTSASVFPYLYDFTLNAWIFYFLADNNPGHYSTNPRYFVNLTTNQIFTM